MLALLAAVAFLVGLIITHPHMDSSTTWLFVGLILLSLHFVFTVALPGLIGRRSAPPQ